jgi:hypothetical protein
MRPTKYHVISSVVFPFGSVIFQPLGVCARHFNRMTRRGNGFFNGGALARPRPYLSFANNPVFRDIQKKLAVNEVSPREETS